MRVIPLGGAEWAMREALGEAWRWHVDSDRPGWLPATVPGSVIHDLWTAGDIPDPYHGRNSRCAEWTATRCWVYRRVVDLPAHDAPDRAVLEFDGLDPSGEVFWDGRPLGRVDGLYHRLRVPTPSSSGRHRLAVVLDPVPTSQPQVGRTDLVRVHRPRLNEGWDFCPRFPHQGIWRPVRLVLAAAHLADAVLRASLAADGTGRITVTARVEAAQPVPFRVTVRDPDGELVAAHAETGVGELAAELTVAGPTLWQPRGLGAPALYGVGVELDGAPVWRRTVGFRRAELVGNPGAAPDSLPYTAVVNGAAVPLVGWNWVPAEAQYGAVDPAKVRHLIELAARSGARLLRVWGGGLLETEEFYDACDRSGLLVWQEFSQSGSGIDSAPSTDAGFVEVMRREATAVIPARAHHPSLLAWGGGNELAADGAPLDETGSPVLAALRERVRRLDPGRGWFPTSPNGASGRGDVHGPWEYQGLREQQARYDDLLCLAHTEFGVEGMTNRRALDRLVAEPDRWPADRSNAVYRHLGDWWNNAPMVQECFGHRIRDLDTLRRASQLLQATGLAYAVEAGRRRYPRQSMVLPWQLDESYPNAWCTSCVDHLGEPKPAYHAVARAFAARRVTVRVPTSVWHGSDMLTAQGWVWSETGEPAGSRVRAWLCSTTGDVLAERCRSLDAAVREPRPVVTLAVPAANVPGHAVVVWHFDWESAEGGRLDCEAVLACTGPDFAPLLDVPIAEIDVTTRLCAEGWRVRVAHRAGPLLIGLQLVDGRPADAPGWLLIGGDPRPLLPRGVREFLVQTPAPAPVHVQAWNIRSVRLDLVEGPTG